MSIYECKRTCVPVCVNMTTTHSFVHTFVYERKRMGLHVNVEIMFKRMNIHSCVYSFLFICICVHTNTHL